MNYLSIWVEHTDCTQFAKLISFHFTFAFMNFTSELLIHFQESYKTIIFILEPNPVLVQWVVTTERRKLRLGPKTSIWVKDWNERFPKPCLLQGYGLKFCWIHLRYYYNGHLLDLCLPSSHIPQSVVTNSNNFHIQNDNHFSFSAI